MASKSNGLEPSDWARAPVHEGPALQRFLKAIYNPEEKSFLGRTPKRWAIVFTFYLVFYLVLALLFACCWGGLMLSLDNNKPTYILDRSLIGVNPGVAYRPLPADFDKDQVKYDKNNASYYEQYTLQLAEFLKPYASKGRTDCIEETNYGYPDNPCFYIKLNKIYGWEPDCYEKGSLPDDMPEDLKEFINEDADEGKKIWISCAEEGGNSTNIEYPWGRGLASNKYPYTNQLNYASPIVAVMVTPTVNKPAIIRCRAWAKNIDYNKSIKEPRGYTRFQLLVEDSTS